MMLNSVEDSIDIDSSIDSSLLQGLTEDQKDRLTDQLDRYLIGLEQGQPLDIDQCQRVNPDIHPLFQEYLQKLNVLVGVPAFRSMTLGDFTITREIGRGGMGVVYEADQPSLNRRVAIKILPAAALCDSRQIARFKNEARAAGLLQHTNIVPVYSVGSDRGVHYYAMQYIDGVSMDAWIEKQRLNQTQLPAFEQIIRWAADIASALHTAHEAGIIHRDVKPSNLMLDQQGKIWITDFGLARCQNDHSLTRSGDLVGTMRYMSPEQARGQNALVDGRADIYSLAATVYEMLSLQPAHRGADAATILQKIEEDEIVPLRKMSVLVPRDLETVLTKALAKNRDHRYETAAAFADDLNRVLRGEPTFARPPTIADRITRLATKHRSLVLTTSLIGVLSLIGFAIGTAMLAGQTRISDANAIRATHSERLAHENEQLARGAVIRLGSQMAELLSDIPAADLVRRRLLQETLDYYNMFVQNASNDPRLREDLAITYGKIGNLHGDLGDTEKSIIALQKSEQLYSQLVAENAGSTDLQLDWSTSQNNLAQRLHHSGQLEQSAVFFARAITLQRTLCDTNNSAAAPFALATSLNNLGLLLVQADAIREAETAYSESITILQSLSADDEDEKGQNLLATVLTNISGLLSTHSPQQAIKHAAAALDYQLKALESEPGNAKLATQVVVSLNTLATCQANTDKLDSAIDSLRQAIDIGDQLHARWPEQPTYQRDLMLSWNQLGLTLSKQGKLTLAREAFEQSLDFTQRLVASVKEDAELHSMMGSVLNNLGFVQQQLGDLTQASQSYRDAIAAQKDAILLAPQVERYRDCLRKHQENLAATKNVGTT